MDRPIIVTGCQRSGTSIASLILANSKQYVLFEEDIWLPNYESIVDLKRFIDGDRRRFVIQSPTAINCFHYIHHYIPEIQFVGVKRPKEEIIASMKRKKWLQDDYPDYLPFYNHHIRFMNSQWGLLKQLLPPEDWVEVNYSELAKYPEFIPQDQRINFTVKQTQLNKPKGPKYWLNAGQEHEETPQITSKGRKSTDKTESTENTG